MTAKHTLAAPRRSAGVDPCTPLQIVVVVVVFVMVLAPSVVVAVVIVVVVVVTVIVVDETEFHSLVKDYEEFYDDIKKNGNNDEIYEVNDDD